MRIKTSRTVIRHIFLAAGPINFKHLLIQQKISVEFLLAILHTNIFTLGDVSIVML